MTREMMMNDDDEKTVRRGVPVEERTRVVARGVAHEVEPERESTRLRAASPERFDERALAGTSHAEAGLRVARVPGPEVDAARYGVRREPLTVPVTRTETPETSSPVRPRAGAAPVSGSRRRVSLTVTLGVGALAVAIVVAAILFVVGITA
jgi:hypothetical protein